MRDKIDDNILKLEESGCEKDIIVMYSQFYEEKNKPAMICMLRKYRKELQESIDENCKLIDCIDYLIYEIGKDK